MVPKVAYQIFNTTAWTPNNMGYLCDPTDGLNDDIGLQKLISLTDHKNGGQFGG